MLNAGISHRLGALQRAWDRIATSDPGLQRLGTAARTTLGVAAAVGAAELAVRFAHAPFTVEILAAIIAEISAISVLDPDAKARRFTTILLPLPVIVTITLGALIGSNRILSDLAFLAILFAAVAMRRFGPRLTALGTLAFFGFFMSIFLHGTLAQVPWSIAAILAGTACTFILRFMIFPDRPQRIVRRAVATFRARERAVLDALPAALAARHWDDPPRRRVRRTINLLKESALAIEDRLAESGNFSGAEKTTLRLALFDAELAAENLVSRALAAANAQPERAREIAAAVDAVWARFPHVPVPDSADRRLPTSALRAMRAGAVAMDRIEGAQHRAELPEAPQARKTQRSARRHGSGSLLQRLSPATRQAIQATLASALALVCGELLSPRRWYWAVLAAFVVFSGTQSSGETRARGWSRSLGTALGIVGGLAIGLVVGHDHTLQLLLLFAFMFGAMYFFGVAYGVFVFFITALLALLYLILGNFSPSLLLLRLIETAVGSTIGVLVATFVLPTSTRDALGTSAARLLGTLATVIERSATRLNEPAQDDDPAIDTRDLDRALTDLWLARDRPAPRGYRARAEPTCVIGSSFSMPAHATRATSHGSPGAREPRLTKASASPCGALPTASRRTFVPKPTTSPATTLAHRSISVRASSKCATRSTASLARPTTRPPQPCANWPTLYARSRNSAAKKRRPSRRRGIGRTNRFGRCRIPGGLLLFHCRNACP